jgi:hypothetical protein
MDRHDDAATVPVGRLDDRGDRRRAAAVVGLIGLVVVTGLASAQLQPEAEPRLAIAPSERTAPASDTPPRPSGSFVVTPPRLRAGELAEAVVTGSLDNTMVYADATLEIDCGGKVPPCPEPRLAVDGLALDVLPGTFGTPIGTPLPRSVLVLQVRGSALVYRGALIVQSSGTPRYEVLAGGSAARPPDPSALTDVAGWLMLDGPCTSPPSAFQPCPRLAMLADERPTPTGHRRADAAPPIAVPRGAWGIDDAGSSIVEGPFLVRPNPSSASDDDAPAWQIVARYDPSRSVRVVIP